LPISAEERTKLGQLVELARRRLAGGPAVGPAAEQIGGSLAARDELAEELDREILRLAAPTAVSSGSGADLLTQIAADATEAFRVYRRCCFCTALIAWLRTQVRLPVSAQGNQHPLAALLRAAVAELARLDDVVATPGGARIESLRRLSRSCSALTYAVGLRPPLTTERIRSRLLATHQGIYGRLGESAQMLVHAEALELDTIDIPGRPMANDRPPRGARAVARAAHARRRAQRQAGGHPLPETRSHAQALDWLSAAGESNRESAARAAWRARCVDGLRELFDAPLQASPTRTTTGTASTPAPPRSLAETVQAAGGWQALGEPSAAAAEPILASIYCAALEYELRGYSARRKVAEIFGPLASASSTAQRDFGARTGIGGDVEIESARRRRERVSLKTYSTHHLAAYDAMVGARTPVRAQPVEAGEMVFDTDVLGALGAPTGVYAYRGWKIVQSDSSTPLHDVTTRLLDGYFGRIGFAQRFLAHVRQAVQSHRIEPAEGSAISSVGRSPHVQYLALVSDAFATAVAPAKRALLSAARGKLAETARRLRTPNDDDAAIFLQGLLFTNTLQASTTSAGAAAGARQALRAFVHRTLLTARPGVPGELLHDHWTALIDHIFSTDVDAMRSPTSWHGAFHDWILATVGVTRATPFWEAVQHAVLELLRPASATAATLERLIVELVIFQFPVAGVGAAPINPTEIADSVVLARPGGASITVVHRFGLILPIEERRMEAWRAGLGIAETWLYVRLDYTHMYRVEPTSGADWRSDTGPLGLSGISGNAVDPHVHLELSISLEAPSSRHVPRPLAFIAPLMFFAPPAGRDLEALRAIEVRRNLTPGEISHLSEPSRPTGV
jgi:hypothetical protein